MSIVKLILMAGKIIGGAKSVKNIYDFASEDWEKKRKIKEQKEELKRQRELIETIEKRNIIETFIMYLIAGIVAMWVASLGIIGAFFVLICYLVHINELYKVSKNVKIIREAVFTGISMVLVIGSSIFR